MSYGHDLDVLAKWFLMTLTWSFKVRVSVSQSRGVFAAGLACSAKRACMQLQQNTEPMCCVPLHVVCVCVCVCATSRAMHRSLWGGYFFNRSQRNSPQFVHLSSTLYRAGQPSCVWDMLLEEF